MNRVIGVAVSMANFAALKIALIMSRNSKAWNLVRHGMVGPGGAGLGTGPGLAGLGGAGLGLAGRGMGGGMTASFILED